MTRLVVDSWACVECLSGSELGAKADRAVQGGTEIWTSVYSVAEVVCPSSAGQGSRKGRV